MITKVEREKLENLYKKALRENKELSTSSNRSSYTFSQGYEHGVQDTLRLLGFEFAEIEAMFQEVVKEK